MLLILTNSQDATADYLIPVLQEAGISHFRLDTDTLIARSSASFRPRQPLLVVAGTPIQPDQITHIWYRRPEALKDERFNNCPEGRFALSEWSEAVEGVLSHVQRERWMNHPSSNASASHKLEQLTTALSLGFTIPDTLLTQDADDARAFYHQHDGQVIVKPMSNGYVERPKGVDSLIYTNRLSDEDLASLDDLSQCPTLFQHCIAKASDVRITVVDHAIHAVCLRATDADGHQRCDIRRNNMSDVAYSDIELPDHVSSLVRRLVDHYGLRFAAIDMVVDLEQQWHFLEVNPNGQWAWLDIAGATNIARSFVESFSDD